MAWQAAQFRHGLVVNSEGRLLSGWSHDVFSTLMTVEVAAGERQVELAEDRVFVLVELHLYRLSETGELIKEAE